MTITQNTKREIIIIGGGPAGITSAIQLTRYGLEPILLEKRELGGLLWNANLVENYPGFPNGVAGTKLIQLIKKQSERIGVSVTREEVVKVDWEGDCFSVDTEHEVRITDYLVIASGTKSKPLPGMVSPEAQVRVFTEVWPLLKEEGKRVVIIGAGDAAFDYALNLSKRGNFVTILNRGETVKCIRLLFERAAREPRIAYRARTAVKLVESQRSKIAQPSTLDFRLNVVCETETFEADYVLFAIGRVPNLGFLSNEVRQREQELVTLGRLYFVGDVKNELYRQVAIAAGDGLRAAMEIYSRISNENFSENR